MAIRFPIVTTFDDKAVGKADKAFSALGKKFAAIFSVGAVIKFGKDSVKAFQDAEKEANLLRTQLESINLGFASPFVNQYIDNLALLSGVSGGVLTDAFNSLSQATEDVTTAQKLLNTALDISAGTSKDLRTVTSALQRAYLGETTALAKLRIGYTTADLKARDFDEVLAELQNKFQGSSAKAADTLAGKMARLTESVEQAKEAFGEGLVKGLQDSQVEIEQLQEDVIGLGDALGYAAGQATGFFAKAFQDIVKDFEESDGAFQQFVRSLVKSTAEVTRLEEERGRAGLRARNRILKAEQSITKTKKEQDKLADKEKKNALAIAKAKAVFDIEKIQIEAALQGKITEEERTRLMLMKAILAEDGATATALAEKLKEIQKQTTDLATSLTNLKAGNPFSEWDGYFAAAKKNITDLFNTLAQQQSLLNELMSSIAVSRASANANVLAAKTDKASTFKEAAEASSVFAELSSADAINAVAQAAAAVASATTPEEKAAAQEAVDAANAYVDATSLLTESLAAADLAAALASLELANEYLNQSIEAATSQGIIPETTINVTVEGNVTSAEDLAEVITDIQYNYQRTGKNLLLSSRAI
jgi:hypothetical protein